MRNILRVLLVFAVLGALAVPAVAPGEPARAEGTTPSPSEELDDAQLMLLLNASGSMADLDASGAPRIDAARSAIGVTVDALRDEQRVGLRVFGATVAEADAEGACTDSQQLVPIGVDNRAEMLDAAEQYEPHGQTLMGYALEQAAEDLGASGKRSILLVSDGLANCEPDPCEVAGALADDGIALMINVVGFDLDEDARAQLSCIADAGNGSYVDASDAEGLERAAALATRAFRPFTVMGEPVLGTPEATSAPVLEPGTQYVDELSADAETVYYRIDRQIAGSTIAVGLSGRAPVEPGIATLTASLYPADDLNNRCAIETENITNQNAYNQIGVGLGVFDAADDPCMMAESLILEISMDKGLGQACRLRSERRKTPTPRMRTTSVKGSKPSGDGR